MISEAYPDDRSTVVKLTNGSIKGYADEATIVKPKSTISYII